MINNLIELREKTGLSQAEVCRRTGIQQSRLSSWENGYNASVYDKNRFALQSLADLYGVSTQYLEDQIANAYIMRKAKEACKNKVVNSEPVECEPINDTELAEPPRAKRGKLTVKLPENTMTNLNKVDSATSGVLYVLALLELIINANSDIDFVLEGFDKPSPEDLLSTIYGEVDYVTYKIIEEMIKQED